MRKRGIATVIAIIAAIYIILFWQKYNIMICDTSTCSVFSKRGVFTKKILIEKFNKNQIKNYIITHSVKDLFVKTSYQKHGHNYHDEYKVRLYLYDDRIIDMPFSFYDDRKKAERYVFCIKNNPSCKYNDYFAFFSTPWR